MHHCTYHWERWGSLIVLGDLLSSVSFLFFSCLQLKSWTWPLSISAQPHYRRKTTGAAEQRAQLTALRSMTDRLLLVRAKTQSSLSSWTVCMIQSAYAYIRPEFCLHDIALQHTGYIYAAVGTWAGTLKQIQVNIPMLQPHLAALHLQKQVMPSWAYA